MSNDEVMNRRGFFRRSFGKVASVGSDYVEQKVAEKAKSWIRPPFAQDEFDFILACSRCGDCIDACPHNVIFSLPLQRGASVASTPAMDIPTNACLLCSDWACVTACKDGALSFSVNQVLVTDITEEPHLTDKSANTNNKKSEECLIEGNSTVVVELPQVKDCPPMASASIDEALCMPYSGPECGACKGSCPIPNTLVWHNEKPSINVESCIGCGQCIQSCITNPKAITISQYLKPVEKVEQHNIKEI